MADHSEHDIDMVLRPKLLSTGRWWDRAWSLVGGCTPCSPACDHCWSARWSHRFLEGTVTEAGEFNGVVRFRADRLGIPARRRVPTVWAVWNDLFHDRIQPNEIMDALGVMARCEQHLFMVLTKRADRMRELAYRYALNSGWMPRNVCLGVSVWDQGSAEANIPPLLEAKRMTGCRTFVSYEPALGPVQFDDLVTRRGDCEDHRDCLHCDVGAGDDQEWGGCSLDLVIMGGESGPGARPMHPDWARSVRDQCQAAGVPFLMKQMSGRTAAERKAIPDDLNIREWFKE